VVGFQYAEADNFIDGIKTVAFVGLMHMLLGTILTAL